MKPNSTIHISRQIELLSVKALRPSPRNARTHSKAQIAQIAQSINQFGFTNPVHGGEKTIQWSACVCAGAGGVKVGHWIG